MPLLFLAPTFCHASGITTAKPDTTLLTEITVTAIKGGVLSHQPVASTTLHAEEVEKLGIVSVKGISDVVPNFFIPDYGSRMTSSIYVRGIGARIDQPAVGLSVDNVPIFNKDAYDFDIPDISAVEMLRGPQSTLFGRNTMGGLINVTTLSPIYYQGVKALLEYGRENSLRAAATVYQAPTDNFGFSAGIYYTRTDGFFTNEYNGKKADKENQLSGRIKAEWAISPTLTLTNTAAVSKLRQGGYPYKNIDSGVIAYNDTCFYRRLCFTDGLTLKLSLPDVTLTSITSAQYIDDNMTLDQDFLPLPYFTLTQKRRELVWTQDFVAKRATPGKWQWLGGLFAFYRNSHMQAPVTFLDEGISRLIEDHRNDANPGYPIRWQERELLLQSSFSLPAFGIAAYHQSTLKLDAWEITAGLRLDYERTELSFSSYCNSGYNIFCLDKDTGLLTPYIYVPLNIDDKGSHHQDFLQLLPKLAVQYNISSLPASNVYFSVTKGYKAGGYNTQMFSDVLQQRLMGVMGIGTSYRIADIITYKPEKSWNFEVGTHLGSTDGKLHTDISAFYIHVSDQQLTTFPDGTTTGRMMTNAGRTRSFGGEISLRYQPIHQLALQSAYGYTNAKFTHYNNGKADYSGRYLPYAPQHTLFVSATSDLPLNCSWCNSIELSADLNGAGPIYWDEANTRRQNFYAQLGLSATLHAPKWSLSIWGKNLTDTKYDTFYFVSMGNEFLQEGKPITFGATLRININS